MSFEQEVVGEAYHQAAFEKICGPRCEEGESLEVSVVLVPEPANQFDPNAVAVTVNGLTVGYLARSDASMYVQMFGKKRLPCTGMIVGGWENDKSKGHYGIRLDIPDNPVPL